MDTDSVDLDKRCFRVDSKELCGALVELHIDDTVKLVHHTAKRYEEPQRNLQSY